MYWYGMLTIAIVAIVGLIIGFVVGLLYCDKNASNETVGDLFVTKEELQPYLVAKIPMESIVEQTYVTFEVKVVDDSQK